MPSVPSVYLRRQLQLRPVDATGLTWVRKTIASSSSLLISDTGPFSFGDLLATQSGATPNNSWAPRPIDQQDLQSFQRLDDRVWAVEAATRRAREEEAAAAAQPGLSQWEVTSGPQAGAINPALAAGEGGTYTSCYKRELRLIVRRRCSRLVRRAGRWRSYGLGCRAIWSHSVDRGCGRDDDLGLSVVTYALTYAVARPHYALRAIKSFSMLSHAIITIQRVLEVESGH